MLGNLKQQGITIIVSTPYMNEAALCDRVALMQKGKTLEINSPNLIVNEFKKPLFFIKADNMYELRLKLLEYEHSDTIQPFGEYLHYTDKRNEIHPDEIKKYLEEKGMNNVSMEPAKPNIEDCFMELMDKS